MSTLFAAACQQSFLPSLYSGLAEGPGCKVKIDSINDMALVLANAVQILLALAGVLAVVFIIWSGLQYITSEGDPGKVASAKSGLLTAILGLLLASAAFLIVKFLSGQMGR